MSYLFSFVFPWLLVFWFLQKLAFASTSRLKHESRPSRFFLFALALLSLGIIMLPVGGIPLGRWLAGPNLSPSIPLLGLLTEQVLQGFFGRELFRPGERQAAWIFGALVGTLLYPFAMGLGSFDPYALGWGWSALFPIIALLTIYLIWKQNRFALLLLVSIVAYDLRWLESPNFWDYLVDPVYWLLSTCVLVKGVWERISSKKAAKLEERLCSPARAK